MAAYENPKTTKKLMLLQATGRYIQYLIVASSILDFIYLARTLYIWTFEFKLSDSVFAMIQR